MSGFLLDTHALLWWLSDPSRLTQDAREVIASGHNDVFVSAAVAWEMSINKTLGRLDYPSNFSEVLEGDHIEVLPVTLSHALAVADLPLLHHDPFDRIQIAQARLEVLALITRDSTMGEYDVPVLWA